jgi:hypothetical protein
MHRVAMTATMYSENAMSTTSETPDQNSFIVSFIVFPCFDEVQGH